MQHILDAIMAGDTSAEDFANLDLPESYRAVTVHEDEVDMFEGIPSKDKDPRKSLHVEDVALPELGPGEAYVAVMASAINYNTVWTSIFEPVSTFGFLERYGRLSPLPSAPRPALPRGRLRPRRRGAEDRPGRAHLAARRPRSSRTASRWSSRTPTATTTRCSTPSSGSGASRRTSAGSPHIALVKANQLMPKPEHLTWEEAASPGLVNCTAYRQLVTKNGGQHEAGRQRADLGRLRRPGRLRHPVRPQRRRHPGLRGLQRGEGRRSRARWARS